MMEAEANGRDVASPMQTKPDRRMGPGAYDRFRSCAWILVLYEVATWGTDAHFMGDTWAYAQAIVNHARGSNNLDTLNPFWEFGHLFWRPLGWLFFHGLQPLLSWIPGGEGRVGATLSLLVINWVAGLASVLLFHRIAS